MKELRIKIHSVVDVITNSSTTIYTMAGAGTIKTIKLMVDSILTIAGSDLKAEDMFDFELEVAGEGDFRWDKWYNEHPEVHDLKWDDRRAAYAEYAEATRDNRPDWWDEYEGSDYSYEDVYLHVTAKLESYDAAAKVLDTLSDLFSHEAERDG